MPREYADKQLVKSQKIAVHKIFLILVFGYQGTLTIRQYSGIYADTDKNPAVLRDFSCIDFGMGENRPFLRHNISLSIHCPFSDSQWSGY